jgi:hypothetical protein
MSPGAVPAAEKLGDEIGVEAAMAIGQDKCTLPFAPLAARIPRYPSSLGRDDQYTAPLATKKSESEPSGIPLNGSHHWDNWLEREARRKGPELAAS